ncbi:TolC family protein [Spirosoma linguale]|uniref:Outer membrane protein-like protein n=1 Tax=Spirosoma linguale (strain ATCC 33905 / DSM 74 / LMG 10896 / Claus 1) TaxID=504472 RepID=D2QIR1_SPILD|nr:Outer membrane protein-like protein [Spirosoma linguale DSM 74]
MKTIIFGLSLLIGSQLISAAQAQPAGTSSDTTLFTAADFYRVVFSHHPLVRQAALLNSEAQQEIMQARGAFDPKLFSTYDRKEFGQDLYYNKWQSGLTIPVLPAGIDVKLTYDRNMGQYVNPEERVPSSGLAAVGVRVPVGQGLIIDARRNALRQAKLAVTLADAERLKLINKTLFDAAKTYWEWYMAHQQYRLIQNGYQVADTRFRAIQQRSLLGDAAAIDTTEALITAQDRLVQLQQAEVNLQNARLRLSVFLWNSTDSDGMPQPVELLPTVAPQPVPADRLDESTLQALLSKAAERHPELLKLTTKGQQLALEERFQRSLLQPQLVLNANLLSRTPAAGVGYDWASYYAFRADNHKIGVDLTFPIFLRKERGKLRQIQIKNQQVTLERQQTGRAISNDVQAAWNELKALERQIDVQQQTVRNQRILLGAEQQKFDIGESSLFLVNSRESKLIDLEIKLEELRTKQQKAVAALWYAAGTNPEAQ